MNTHLDELDEIFDMENHGERKRAIIRFIKNIPFSWTPEDWVELADNLVEMAHRIHVHVVNTFLSQCPYENLGPDVEIYESPKYYFARMLQNECIARLALTGARECTREDQNYMLLAIKAAQITKVNLTNLFSRWRGKFGEKTEGKKTKILPNVVEQQMHYHIESTNARKKHKTPSARALEYSALEEQGWTLAYTVQKGRFLRETWVHEKTKRKAHASRLVPKTSSAEKGNTEKDSGDVIPLRVVNKG